MALILSAATGNFNAPATWVGGVVPTTGDEARASTGHTITITANATCTQISNAGTGTFVLNSGVTLTANVTNKSATTAVNCLSFSSASPATASIVGDITGGSANPSSAVAVTGTGTLSITGICTGGTVGASHAVSMTATGAVVIVGNCLATSGNPGCAVSNTGGGSVTITGDVTGGSNGFNPSAVQITTVSGSVSVTGNITGPTGVATAGAILNSTAGLTSIVGNITASVGHGVLNSSTGTLTISGGTYTASTTANAVSSTNTSSIVRASGSFIYASNGIVPINAAKFILLTTPTAAKTRYALNGTGTFVDMFTADNTGLAPAVGDVRAGVVYGSATGALAVPSANSVAFGVAVDNTTGTAVLTLADVQSALTAQGLTSARAGNLDNLDTTVSSRLSPSGTLARVTLTDTATTLTNAPTVPTAAEIATAVEGSLLNESDGQAVLNAIVGAIGNTNLSEVSLVAAVRADLERTGGKLDSIPTTSAPSASTVAGAVRSELGTELGRIDAAISSRLAAASYTAPTTPPTAAQNASAVRTELSTELARIDAPISGATAPSAATVASAVRSELSTELGRVDAAISSRMAASEATKLDGVKAKTDLLNTDRLANVATTNIVGTLLAQANS